MTNEFITEYCENLKKLGFSIAAGDSRCIEVQNSAGQAANLGVVIDADAFADDLKQFIDAYSAAIAARAEGSRLRNIFVVYILVTSSRREDIDALLEQAEAFDNQRIYNIYWAVTPEACTMDHNKNQPGEVGGMAKAIGATLKNEAVDSALAPVSRHVFLTYVLIALNGAVFALIGITLPASDPYRMITAGAIVPELVLSGQYWRLVAAMFIHFDVMHLAANCLSLYVFGSIVERFLGTGKLAAIYFVSGIFASVLCLTQQSTVSAGASGAVYGLIGAAAVITWRARGRAELNFYNMAILIAVGIGISFIVPGISYTAHIGGLVAGTALGWLLSRADAFALKG